jgi:hypothetical protein
MTREVISVKSFLLLLLIATTTLFAYLYLSKNDTKNSITLGASLPLSGINKKLGEKVDKEQIHILAILMIKGA